MTYRSPTVDALYSMSAQDLRSHLAGLLREAKLRLQGGGDPAVHAALAEELAAVELLLVQASRTGCERLQAALETKKRQPTGDAFTDVVAELDDPGPARPETPEVGTHAPGRPAAPAPGLSLPDSRENSPSGAPRAPIRPPARVPMPPLATTAAGRPAAPPPPLPGSRPPAPLPDFLKESAAAADAAAMKRRAAAPLRGPKKD